MFDLHEMCNEGNLGKITKFLEDTSEYHHLVVKDSNGYTPLHYACFKGHKDVTSLFLSRLKDEDVIVKNNNGDTPLHFACVNGHKDVTSLLLGRLKDNDLIMKNIYGDTPLHDACGYGQIDVAILLLSKLKDNDLIIKDKYGNTPLHDACRNVRKDVASLLLSRLKDDDLVVENNRGDTPLHEACRNDAGEITSHLLAKIQTIRDDSIPKADEIRESCKEIMEVYRKDPEGTRRMLREELGITTKDVAGCFALVVGLCDGYFELKENTGQIDAGRFFNIVKKLPMELQMIICNRAHERERDVIKSVDLDAAIVTIF